MSGSIEQVYGSGGEDGEETITRAPTKTFALAEWIDGHLLELYDQGHKIEKINDVILEVMSAGVTIIDETGEWFEADHSDWFPQPIERLNWLLTQRQKHNELPHMI